MSLIVSACPWQKLTLECCQIPVISNTTTTSPSLFSYSPPVPPSSRTLTCGGIPKDSFGTHKISETVKKKYYHKSYSSDDCYRNNDASVEHKLVSGIIVHLDTQLATTKIDMYSVETVEVSLQWVYLRVYLVPERSLQSELHGENTTSRV